MPRPHERKNMQFFYVQFFLKYCTFKKKLHVFFSRVDEALSRSNVFELDKIKHTLF